MNTKKYPKGWNQNKAQRVVAYYEHQRKIRLWRKTKLGLHLQFP